LSVTPAAIAGVRRSVLNLTARNIGDHLGELGGIAGAFAVPLSRRLFSKRNLSHITAPIAAIAANKMIKNVGVSRAIG
jgi:hypothetical protein